MSERRKCGTVWVIGSGELGSSVCEAKAKAKQTKEREQRDLPSIRVGFVELYI